MKNPSDTFTLRALAVTFAVYALLVSVIFFGDQIIYSASKPLWGDETYGLTYSIRMFTYPQLLTEGAYGQSSPSPLFYMVGKLWDDSRAFRNPFNLPDEVYYRLGSNIVTGWTVLAIMLIFMRTVLTGTNPVQIKILQLVLLAFLPIALCYTYMVYYYAAEFRPYALWNSLYLLALAASFWRKNSIPLIICLILLSMTATAAAFQISAMIAAFFITHRLEQKPLQSNLKELLKIFFLPTVITAYYCLQLTAVWGDTDPSSDRKIFIELWTHKHMIAVYMTAAIALCLCKKENRKYTAAPLAFLLLYLMAPLIYAMTKARGYFFTERQYVYYDLMFGIFLLTLIQCLPAYLRDIRNRTLLTGAVIVISLLVGGLVLRPKIVRNFKNAVYNTCQLITN